MPAPISTFQFPTQFSQKIFQDRYTLYPEETWRHACKRVADHVAVAEKDVARWSEEFYDVISTGEFCPGGRIWYGAGRRINGLLNCFVLPVEDSREGWAKLLGDNLVISGTGGGSGSNFSKIRPRGVPIRGTGGFATGAVSLMRIDNGVDEEIKGGAGRRSAKMKCLNLDHPDLEEFLDCKLDLGQLNNANISVIFNSDPQEFFDKVRNNQDWELVWNNEVLKTIPAKQIWDRIVTNFLKNGEPGLLNGYLANRLSNISYCRELVSTNPCFPASEYLLTDNGYESFGNLHKKGLPNMIHSDGRISYTDDGGSEKPENWNISSEDACTIVRKASAVKLTQNGASIVKVVFEHGPELRCTPDHLIATTEGMIEAQFLTSEHKVLISKPVPKQSIVGLFPTTSDEISSLLMGLIAGDGTFSVSKIGTEQALIDLWNCDEVFLNHICELIQSLYEREYDAGYEKHGSVSVKNTWDFKTLSPYSVVYAPKQNKIRIQSVWLATYLRNKYGFKKNNKHVVPEFIMNNARNTVAQYYVAALYFCDGTLNGNDKACDIRLAQSNKQMLQQVQMLLQANGIYSSLHLRREAAMRNLPDGKGGLKQYFCKTNYELISCNDRQVFINTIGFLGTEKDNRAKNNSFFMRGTYNKQYFAKLKYRSQELPEDVYCLQEPVARNITVNTIVAKRCGEIFMQPYSTCCLGSIVLPKFIRRGGKYGETPERLPDPNSREGKDVWVKDVRWRIDFVRLDKAVKTAVRFLDDVLDVTYYPTKELHEESQATRRIGLGTMGVHDMLLQLGLKYASEAGRYVVDRVMNFIKHAAYEAGSELAAEKGVFPEYDEEEFNKSIFVSKHLVGPIRAKIKENGSRCCAYLTQAPTGTTGSAMGTSTGVEPIFAKAMARTYKGTDHKNKTEAVVHPLYEEFVLAGLDTSHFEDASEIHPLDHLRMQEVFQRHTDNAVSKTINIPRGMYSKEEFSDLLMEWFPKLKGITVYPEGSRGEEPLKRLPDEEAVMMIRTGKAVAEASVQDCATGTCAI